MRKLQNKTKGVRRSEANADGGSNSKLSNDIEDTSTSCPTHFNIFLRFFCVTQSLGSLFGILLLWVGNNSKKIWKPREKQESPVKSCKRVFRYLKAEFPVTSSQLKPADMRL
jgi:hypothetical protein